MDSMFLDLLFTFGPIVIGIMILTGHGDVLLKGGNEQLRKNKFDQKKVEKASGIAALAIGIASGVEMFTTGVVAECIYVGVLVVILIVLVVYYQTACKKK